MPGEFGRGLSRRSDLMPDREPISGNARHENPRPRGDASEFTEEERAIAERLYDLQERTNRFRMDMMFMDRGDNDKWLKFVNQDVQLLMLEWFELAKDAGGIDRERYLHFARQKKGLS